MRHWILAVPSLILVACDPLVMIPGGELSGVTQPVPEDWTFTDQFETIQLETRPDNPYSVNIWGVGIGGDFVVASAKADNAWAEHIAADNRVRLRVDGTIYEMRAERDETPEGKQRFLDAAKAKYDFEPDPDQASEAILFKLIPR